LAIGESIKAVVVFQKRRLNGIVVGKINKQKCLA